MNRDAFNRRVVLRKDREHSWRHHGRNGTLLKEVLGILDKWAEREEKKSGYRFVFAHRDTILNLCFKGKREEKKHFSLAHLKRILDELRAEHIISRYFETGDGHWGFVVAPHDSLCYVQHNVCILPNRSVPPAFEVPIETGRLAALAALKENLKKNPSRAPTRTLDEPQHEPLMSPNMSPVSRIEEPQHEPQHEPDQALYLSNFELLTESEKADWLESRKQLGASIPGIRLSGVSDNPYKPSIPSIQDELKRHHEFLEQKSNSKSNPKSNPKSKVKSEDAVSTATRLEPNTEEPKTGKSKAATMKSQDRKRPVLSEADYRKAKADAELKEQFGAVPVFTDKEIAEMILSGVVRVPCQEGNDIIWRTNEERQQRGWNVLSACTIHGGYRCSFGQACWHKG
jgi:hypothetical protein